MEANKMKQKEPTTVVGVRLPQSELKALKKLARQLSAERNKDISAIDLIRKSLKACYPELY